MAEPKPTDWCANCHHVRSGHVPVCTDPMLGFGKYCDCPEFVEESDDEPADPAAEEPAKVRRPSVPPPAG